MRYRILAKVHLYSTEDGGKNLPIAQQFNCPMFLDDSYYECRLYLETIGTINPGETQDSVPIEFLIPELVFPKLSIGKQFKLWENQRFFGEGSITSIEME